MYRKIGVFILLLLAFTMFTAQRYRTKPVTYKYPYFWSFGTETNVRKTFPGNIAGHTWFRAGGSDTVDVWYYIGHVCPSTEGDSTLLRIIPHALGMQVITFDNLVIAGGEGGGVRVIKDTATPVFLWGVTNIK